MSLYNHGIYHASSGVGELIVESSGKITVQNGGAIDVESGGDIDLASGGHIDAASGGYISLASGGYIDIASGGMLSMPVEVSTGVATSSDFLELANFGVTHLTSGYTGILYYDLAAPTRAGLVKHMYCPGIPATTGRIYIKSTDATFGYDSTNSWMNLTSTQSTGILRFTLISETTAKWQIVALNTTNLLQFSTGATS